MNQDDPAPPSRPLHAWPAALFGVGAGLAVLVYFPTLKAVSASLLLFAGFHLVGVLVIASSAVMGWRSRAPATTGGIWRGGWINGPFVAAVVVASCAVALQVSSPGLWPLSFGLLAQAVLFLVGSRMLAETRSAGVAPLPLVDLRLTPTSTVLDAGCGSGRSTLALASAAPARIVALDEPQADRDGRLARLRSALGDHGLGGRVTVECGRLDALPFPDATFEAVISVDVYDHRGASPEGALRDLARVLKPGGRLLLVVRTPSWRSFAVVHMLAFRLPSSPRWRRAIDRAKLRSLNETRIDGRWCVLAEKAGGTV